MKILLYGLNYSPEITGIGKYTGQLGPWLLEQGNDVKVITAPPYYPWWEVLENYRNWFTRKDVGGVDVLRCPLYVPKNPATLSRLLHLGSFVLSSSIALTALIRWRPNVVVNVVPALFTSFPAWIYCCITGAKFVIHVQDFESDALFGLNKSKKLSLFQNAWNKIEGFIFSKADIVTTISYAMMDNGISKGVDASKMHYFPNWSEVSMFENVKNVDSFRRSLLGGRQGKVVLYSGNIGKKQGLGLVAECARVSQEEDDDFLYVLCGDGAGKKDIVELKERYSLNNMFFFPLQPYADFPRLLAMADVHLVIQAPDVANAVLPSKLTNIFAVGGNSVITTEADTEIGRLIDQHPGISIPVNPNDSAALLKGIKLAAKQKKINNVAVNYAKKYLAKDAVLKKFETDVLKKISNIG